MSLKELLDAGLTRTEVVHVAIDQLGMTEAYAEFALAMELGELDGDVIAVPEPPADQ